MIVSSDMVKMVHVCVLVVEKTMVGEECGAVSRPIWTIEVASDQLLQEHTHEIEIARYVKSEQSMCRS